MTASGLMDFLIVLVGLFHHRRFAVPGDRLHLAGRQVQEDCPLGCRRRGAAHLPISH